MARRSLNVSLGARLGNGDYLGAAVHGIPSTVDTVAASDAADALGLLIIAAQGTIATAKSSTASAKVSVDAAKISTALAKTAADDGKTAADLSKTDVDLAQVAAAAAQTGIVALTPLTNAINAVKAGSTAYVTLSDAIATCKATPNQGNADAVDAALNTSDTGYAALLLVATDLYLTAGTGVRESILTLDGLINAAKNACDTAQTVTDAAVAAALATKNAAATADTDTGTAVTDVGTGDTDTGLAKTDVDALDLTDVNSNLAAHAIDEAMDVVVDYNDVAVPDKNSLRQAMNKILLRVPE